MEGVSIGNKVHNMKWCPDLNKTVSGKDRISRQYKNVNLVIHCYLFISRSVTFFSICCRYLAMRTMSSVERGFMISFIDVYSESKVWCCWRIVEWARQKNKACSSSSNTSQYMHFLSALGIFGHRCLPVSIYSGWHDNLHLVIIFRYIDNQPGSCIVYYRIHYRAECCTGYALIFLRIQPPVFELSYRHQTTERTMTHNIGIRVLAYSY